jgi:hypothetical protein
LVNDSSKAARIAAHTPAPWWLWATLALSCPAIVAARSLSGVERTLTVGPLVIVVVAGLVAAWRRERRAPARFAKPAPFLLWRIPMLAIFIGTLQRAGQLTPTLTLAVVGYLTIALGSSFCAHKADAEYLRRVQG